MTELESRFRLLTRAYPASYRELREEEMVATFLESAEGTQGGPSLGDVWDVIRHGLALRLGAWDRHAAVAWRYGIWLSLMAWLSYVGLVQLGSMASSVPVRSWWYSYVLDWMAAVAPLAVALLFLSGAPRTARLVALAAVLPIGGFYGGFGSDTLRFVVPLALVAIAPAPTFPFKRRSMALGVVAVSGFATIVAFGLIPYERILLSSKLVTVAASVAIGFALGWQRTSAVLGVAIAAGAIALLAVQLHRADLQPLSWLVVLLLAATQLPIRRRANHDNQQPPAAIGPPR